MSIQTLILSSFRYYFFIIIFLSLFFYHYFFIIIFLSLFFYAYGKLKYKLEIILFNKS
ncbi:hypothetical protein IIV6-T1_085 [Invertebrate iridescent virus 6]|nr:hypothetical protein IIV6-T1_085 [Invertebrate iridescent virus 6]